MTVSPVPDAANARAAPDVTQASSSSILTRLRLETRDEHNQLERMLDFTSNALTRDVYCQRLEQYYGFYRPLEAALQTRCAFAAHDLSKASSPFATLVDRLNKTRLLWIDLHHLQVPTDGLPLCRELPSIKTQAEVLGCLYVLEGATLGGRVITQHIHATLGITPTTGGGFFEGYAGDTGKMWNAMRHILSTCAVDVASENAMVGNAIATFACLRRWCDPTNVRANGDGENLTGTGPHA